MTDENQIEETVSDELETLKARADMMGIKYHHKEGVDKLKAKINNALSSEGLDKPESVKLTKNVKVLNGTEYKKLKQEEAKKNASRLMRVRVTCMNPMKKEWEGEIFSVGSSKLGTFKRYIPYNVEWHIPKIMYDALKERKCSVFHSVKDHLGQKVRKSRLVQEFSIELLPPLTKDQLKDLAKQQAMTGSIDNG